MSGGILSAVTPLRVLQVILVVYAVIVAVIVFSDYRKNREKYVSMRDKVLHFVIGVVVNFFDALGIGNFATTVAAYGVFNLVDDKKIPGTLNVGIAIPVIFEALMFTSTVKVEFTTLIPFVICGVIGAVVGNRIVRRVSARAVTLGMSAGLMIAALLMLAGKLDIIPAGGDLTGITGIKLVIACVSNFILGIALCFGVGNFAPSMCIIYFLGMSPLVSFPLMMCTGAIATPTTGLMSLKQGLIDRTAVFGLAVGGVIGVGVAVFLVKNMPISVLQWLVIAVVIYSSVSMFMKARKYKAAAKQPEADIKKEKHAERFERTELQAQ